ncbi:C39 family peptidase [Bacillus sp. BRMEA1]|uniref:C39 family peptidase n=1 Tax=Neobacillus endophyticus TaxID=2738405 RepID=UPI001566AA03|nr:C39 family peptidase [Neobacillus endophyticus]NRD77194.1 C39 family peptidase [Neobacillus endophyticus]
MQPRLWGRFLICFFVITISCIPGLAFADTAGQENAIQIFGKVTDQTTAINGTAHPNAVIKITVKDSLLATTNANDAGGFSVVIAKQPANTLLTITEDDGKNTYSFNVTVIATGWIQENGQWYFYNSNSEKQTGWMDDQGKRYFLDKTGARQTGWLLNQGSWYFLNSNGAMQTGWIYNGGYWYYLKANGQMQTGWVLDSGKWYYLYGSGKMATGWVYTGGKWYYLNSNGVMQTSWVKVNGKFYFLNADGSMRTGWFQSGGDWYYLSSSGAVASVILDAPLIAQMPELPRGCEVTSLSMMLRDAGVKADKMTLALQVKKDPTPYSKVNGQVYFGNPYTGFVGDMYSFSNPGLGVYHGPIKELAEKYIPNRVIDFTGSKFEDIYQYLNSGKSVWVINNTLFDTVPTQYWYVWNTPKGKISITYKEHSVLVTGYDSRYIYFNDPLAVIKNRKVAISTFKRGWEQMGSQAISWR